MTRRVLGSLILLSTLHAADAGVSRDVQQLPTRREIQLPNTRQSHVWIEIRQDGVLTRDASPSFEDVRIVTESGEVVPFIATMPTSLVEFQWTLIDSMPLAWQPATPRGYVCRLNLGAGADMHSLALPGKILDYEDMGQVRNRGHWQTIHLELETMSLTPREEDSRTTMRIRADAVELRTAPGASPPSGVAYLYRHVRHCQPIVSIPAPVPTTSFEDRNWQAEYRLVDRPRIVAGLMTTSSSDARFRSYQMLLETSIRGWVATPANTGSLCAPAVPGRFTWSPMLASGVRVSVTGADPPNAPFRADSILVVPMRARAWVPSTGRLWLAYGDSLLRRPAWRLPENVATLAMPVVRLGPPEPNPFYAPAGFGLFWLQRHPHVVGAIMFGLLAVVVFVLVTWRPKPND